MDKNAKGFDADLDNALREAGQQAPRRSRGTSPGRVKNGLAKTAKAEQDLDGLIAGLQSGGANTAGATGPQSPPGALPGSGEGELQATLDALSPINAGAHSRRPQSHSQTRDVAQDSLLNSSATVNPLPANTHRQATGDDATATDLDRALTTADIAERSAHRTAKSSSRLGGRDFLLLALCMALALAGMLWWQLDTSKVLPKDTLQRLVIAVESYRTAHNGQLPATLAEFAEFPKGTLEWPVEYWNARNAAGHDQIIWIPRGNEDYRIILRQGSESWLYSSRNNTTKKISIGRPQ